MMLSSTYLENTSRSSKRIRFEGDGYGEAWEKEAKKRGLSNHKTAPVALKARVSKKTIALFERLGYYE